MDLSQAVAEGLHQRSAASQQQAAQQHASFLERFPRETLPDLPLDRYALGTANTRETYSYALEWGTPRLGSIRGGTSAKHLIFLRRKDSSWHYPAGYESVDTAWADLRAAWVTALDMADKGQWAEISTLRPLARAKTIKLKTLYLYHPEQVLPVYSADHLRHYAEVLDTNVDGDLVTLNRNVLQALRAVPGLAALPGLDLAQLLYRWAPPAGWLTPTWVKIAPGAQASKWQECMDGGYICVGWDEVGDLTAFDSEDEFRGAFAEAFPYNGNTSTITKKARELWRLIELKPGDRVVANKGTSQVVGIGTVTDAAYEWRPERDEYRHTVGVEWEPDSDQAVIPPVGAWATTTVLKIPGPLVERLVGGGAGPSVDAEGEGGKTDAFDDMVPRYQEWEKTLLRKKQLVFYGPPGTGKTRAAQGFARWWLGKELDLAGSDDVDSELATLGYAAHAWWLSEPSWADLFVTGHLALPATAVHSDMQSGDIVMCHETGADRVVGLARVVDVHDGDDLPLRLLPLRQLAPALDATMLSRDPEVRANTLFASRGSAGTDLVPAPLLSRLLTIAGVPDDLMDRTPDDLVGFLTQVTFHASYAYEDFVEGYRPVRGDAPGLNLALRDGVLKRVARTAAADAPNPYVLLIDEINRANVPRVFGELMTVLEADKRGQPVTLPTSGTPFLLPENVYVIGTMNTADRSIRTLDAALRRRFAFLELMPDPAVLAGAVVDDLALDIFLEGLNRRIAASAGREKQIGHSFFLRDGEPLQTAGELAEVMHYEIVPLLQEIAFDEYAQLLTYLGKDLVDAEERRLTSAAHDATSLVAALAKEYSAEVGTNE